MKLLILVFFTCAMATNSFSADQCGIYVLNGIFRKSADPIKNSVYVVNEGKRSELKFKIIRPLDLVRLSLSNSQPTSIKVKVLKKMDSTLGEIDEVLSSDPRFINPLSEKAINMILLEQHKCFD